MYFPRLKDLRNDMDLRQVEVAELLHIRQTVYSRYERGDRTIPVEHLLILADFYKTSTATYSAGPIATNRPENRCGRHEYGTNVGDIR